LEEAARSVEKCWQEKNRHESILRLRKRHESNIGLEIKCGIVKPKYQPALTRSLVIQEKDSNNNSPTSKIPFKLGYVDERSYKDNDTINRLKKAKTVFL